MNRSILIGAVAVIIIVLAAAALMAGKGGGGAATTTTASPAAAATTAAAGQAASPAAAGGGKDTILLGATISQQGKFAHEGKLALCGFQVAIDWVNSHGGVKVGDRTYKLDLKYYDDKSSKSEVPKLYSKLITQDHVDFLLAPYSSGLTLAAVPIAEQYHKLIISHGGASDAIFTKGYKYIVQALSPASYYLRPAVDLLKNTGDSDIKIAFIYEDSAFSKSVAKAAIEYAKKQGLDVVFEQAYPKGTTDFSQIISQAKASGANVLLGGGHFQDGLQLVKQAHDLGWKLKFIAILVAPTLPDFYKSLGPEIAEGVAAPAQWEIGVKYSPELAKQMGYEWYGPTNEEFISMVKEKCGFEPDYHVASAAASILYLVKAIEKAGSLDSDAVRQAFNDLKLMTFFGPMKIDPATGKQVAHPMILDQWQNGKREIVWPPEAATAKPVYPLPNWWGQQG